MDVTVCSGTGTNPISIPCTTAQDWHEEFSESRRISARMNDCDPPVSHNILTGLWFLGSPARKTDPVKMKGWKQASATPCLGSGNSMQDRVQRSVTKLPFRWQLLHSHSSYEDEAFDFWDWGGAFSGFPERGMYGLVAWWDTNTCLWQSTNSAKMPAYDRDDTLCSFKKVTTFSGREFFKSPNRICSLRESKSDTFVVTRYLSSNTLFSLANSTKDWVLVFLWFLNFCL